MEVDGAPVRTESSLFSKPCHALPCDVFVRACQSVPQAHEAVLYMNYEFYAHLGHIFRNSLDPFGASQGCTVELRVTRLFLRWVPRIPFTAGLTS